jgi:large subunit ribosomal protein L4
MIKLALASALSDRVNENRVVVVDDWSFTAPSTKSASAALKSLGVSGSVLVVVGPNDSNVEKSFRNLHDAQVISSNELNAYDVLCNEWVVFTKATLPEEKDGE